MADVAIDLDDLKKLIQALIDHEIDSRCHIQAANRSLDDPELRSRMAHEYSLAKPQQGDTVFLRYREAMNALESGKDIRSAISRLASRVNH